MAPIVKTLPSYTKDSQYALEIVRDFNFLGQDKLYFHCGSVTSLYSVICHSVAQKFFFDPRTVKKPISETRLRSAKLVLIIAFSRSCQILFQFPYPFTSHE